MEQDSRDTNLVVIKTNIEPAEKVLFRLTYEELLERTQGSYTQTFMVDPGQIVEDFVIKVNINESLPIASLAAPELKSSNEIDFSETNTDSSIAVISKNIDDDPAKASVEFTISPEYQHKQGPEGVQGEFSVVYDVDRTNQTSEIQVIDGYFVHFFAPENLPVIPKHIIFVLDVSGSMSGKKLEQLKDAMFTILDEMTEQDYFDIITFSSDTSQATTTMSATDANKKKGQDLILKLIASGGTNIDGALKVAVDLGREMIIKETLKGGQTMILFLTDGNPTVGEQDHVIIVSNIEENNAETKIPIYTLGFGQDADFNLMQKIAGVTDARAKRIYEGSDAALQLEGFYQEIASPLLANIKFKYVGENVDQDSVSSQDNSILFKGSESTVVGKVSSLGESFTAIVTGEGKTGSYEKRVNCSFLPFPNSLPLPPLSSPVDVIGIPDLSPSQSFIKKLYAFLTIKQALKKNDQASQDKALKLALENNFVTKLTSLVVSKENQTKETVEPVPVSIRRPNRPFYSYGPTPGIRSSGVSYSMRNTVMSHSRHHGQPYMNAMPDYIDGVPVMASVNMHRPRHRHRHQGRPYTNAMPDYDFAHTSRVPTPTTTTATTSTMTTTTTTSNYENCKLSLFSKTYKRGVNKELTDTTSDLEDFKDESVSAEVTGQCCWRVYAEPDFKGESLVLRPASTYNSVTSLKNLLRNLKSTQRISC